MARPTRLYRRFLTAIAVALAMFIMLTVVLNRQPNEVDSTTAVPKPSLRSSRANAPAVRVEDGMPTPLDTALKRLDAVERENSELSSKLAEVLARTEGREEHAQRKLEGVEEEGNGDDVHAEVKDEEETEEAELASLLGVSPSDTPAASVSEGSKQVKDELVAVEEKEVSVEEVKKEEEEVKEEEEEVKEDEEEMKKEEEEVKEEEEEVKQEEEENSKEEEEEEAEQHTDDANNNPSASPSAIPLSHLITAADVWGSSSHWTDAAEHWPTVRRQPSSAMLDAMTVQTAVAPPEWAWETEDAADAPALLWDAIKSGQLPTAGARTVSLSAPTTLVDRALTEATDGKAVTVLEIGSADATGVRIATRRDDATVLSILPPETTMTPALLEMRGKEGAENHFAARLQMTPTIARQLVNSGQQVDVQLLPNMTALIGTLLPHEYEGMLAQLLKLAASSIFVPPAANDPFFAFWGGLKPLVERAVSKSGLQLEVLERDIDWARKMIITRAMKTVTTGNVTEQVRDVANCTALRLSFLRSLQLLPADASRVLSTLLTNPPATLVLSGEATLAGSSVQHPHSVQLTDSDAAWWTWLLPADSPLPPRLSAPAISKSDAAAALHKQFDVWWPVLKAALPPAHFTLLAAGRASSLLAVKVARALRGTVVLALQPDKLATEALSGMAQQLRLKNMIVAEEALTPALLQRLASAPAMDAALFTADALEWALLSATTVDDFVTHLSHLLSLSPRSLLLLPPPATLLSAMQLLAADATDLLHTLRALPSEEVYPFLLLRAADVGRQSVSVQLLSPDDAAAPALNAMRAVLVKAASARGSDDETRGQEGSSRPAELQRCLSLSTLLQLKLAAHLRAQLLQLHLQLPLPALRSSLQELPPRLLWFCPRQAQLLVQAGDGRLISSRWRQSEQGVRASRDAILAQLSGLDVAASPRGESGHFSLVEYGSRAGDVSVAVCSRFPAATVVSIESDHALQDAHVRLLAARNVSNNAICGAEVNSRLMADLRASPEFFRFQLLRRPLLAQMARASSHQSFTSFFGDMLSVSLTSFVDLPSAAHVSLAMHTIMGAAPQARSFQLQQHPRPPFHAMEAQLVNAMAVAKQPGLRLALKRLPSELPWLRLDVVNLTRSVNHHFRSEMDGHRRKYTLHVSRNVTATRWLTRATTADNSVAMSDSAVRAQLQRWAGNHVNGDSVISVVLTRQKDSSLIPYSTLRSITLISLLRLELVSSQRTQAYESFLKLPLYIDMAPWNIVMQGRSMEYIDYDTRDVTFDRYLPHTYQLMEVLFNYKRTVEDFKKCGPRGSNPYNFPYVSECVGSSFTGPCPDSALPVPCGDGTCQSDYISCLRAIMAQGREAAGDGSSAAARQRHRVLPQLPSAQLSALDEGRSLEVSAAAK